MRLRAAQSTIDSLPPQQQQGAGEDGFANWRAKAFLKLKDVIPKLKKKKSLGTSNTNNKKKSPPRQSIHKWFEGQRKASLASLGGSDDAKVANLQQLLSLPLDVNDLESCLSLGVAGALQGELPTITMDAHRLGGLMDGSGVVEWTDLEADAEFLAQMLLGGSSGGNSERSTTNLQAEELLERLQYPAPTAAPTASLSSISAGGDSVSSTATRTTGFIGKTAQIAAVMLMIAQVLIGAQLLRRFRKRKDVKRTRGQSGSSSSINRRMSASSSIMLGSDRRSSLASLPPPMEDDDDYHYGTAAAASTPPRANGIVSLERHLSNTDLKLQKAKNGKNRDTDGSDHDDRTAETDSVSLSEGVSQKGDQNVDDDHHHHQQQQQQKPAAVAPPLTSATSELIASHQKEMDLLAMLSFSGGAQLQAAQPLLNTYVPAAAAPLQDKFTLRMNKLKSNLFSVKEEQKTELQDSTKHIQEQYQETNVQYTDLTARLGKLTASIQTRKKTAALAAAAAEEDTNDADMSASACAAFSRSETVTSGNRSTLAATGAFAVAAAQQMFPPSSAIPLSREKTVTASNRTAASPDMSIFPASIPLSREKTEVASNRTAAPPQLHATASDRLSRRTPTSESPGRAHEIHVQVQAQVQASNEEHTKLIQQVTGLQHTLKVQQERHALILQQRESKMADLSIKMGFLNGEIERRTAHAQLMKVATTDDSKLQQHLTALQKQLASSKQEQKQVAQELSVTKQQFTDKEAECQQLLGKLRAVPEATADRSPVQNSESTDEHKALILELQDQLEQQDAMNKRTLEMTQMLETKRAEVVLRTRELEATSKDIDERQAKLEIMEKTAATYQQQEHQQSKGSVMTIGGSTEELEAQLRELQLEFTNQSLECEKLSEILSTKSKLLKAKQAECLDLTARVEELTEQLEEKDEQIEQLEQDVQDKQDLATQNEAITSELQVQQELQEKMNQTTLQMIKLLEEKEQSNAELTNQLETLTTELNQSKSGLL